MAFLNTTRQMWLSGSFFVFLISGCHGTENSDPLLAGQQIALPGVPGVLSVESTFGTSPEEVGKNDRDFLRTNRLVVVKNDGTDAVGPSGISTLQRSFGGDTTNLLLQSFGRGSTNLAAAIENTDFSSAAALAFAALAYGNPPVIFLEDPGLYQLPSAVKIGGRYYVFGVDTERTTVSYYDCIRYAFLMASAWDGKLEYGFDVALWAARSRLPKLKQEYPDYWQRNSIALKLLASLQHAQLPYQMSEVKFIAKGPSESIDVRNLKAGDIMVYTPPSTHPLDPSDDYFKSARFHGLVQLAFNSGGYYLKNNPSTLELRTLDSAIAMKMIDTYIEKLRSDEVAVFRWLNESMLRDQEYNALREGAQKVLIYEWNRAQTRSAFLQNTQDYYDGLAEIFSRNTQVFGRIAALSPSGAKVEAELVHSIPSFHVAMITQVKDGKATVFQIDGANGQVGSSFQDLQDVLTPGSFVNFLERQ